MDRSPLSIPVLTAAAVLAWGSCALAQTARSVSKDMGVSGNSPTLCILGQAAQSNVAPLLNAATTGTGTVEIVELRDETTLSTAAARFSLTFDGMCNYPHRLSFESSNNGLFRPASAADTVAGFGTGVPYTATLSWGSTVVEFSADAQRRGIVNGSQVVNAPIAGPLLMTVLIRAGATNLRDGAPLVGGRFSDTLRITVEPQ